MQQPGSDTQAARDDAGSSASGGKARSGGLHLTVASALVFGGLASLLTVAPEVAFASGPLCATSGAQGAGGTLANVVNTYYPATGSYAAGATSLAIGTPTGSTTPVAAGDELLVIQVQGATVNTADSNNYGAGNGTGRGATAITAGTYEYVRATSGVTGGAVTITGAGGGGGLVNAYTNTGNSRVEVIRIPQYTTATLGSTLTASAWNGTSGGVLALDVSGTLALGGATVSLNGLGFRGGLQRAAKGATGGANTDYVTSATFAANGEKAEGYAGTPSFPTSTTVDGYTGGDFGRGAPGNAGGGATDGNPTADDQNAGGGGGGNGGIGGLGGNSWKTNLVTGGLGGAAYAASVSRVVLGGGGGAGSNNDGTTSSTGAAGGGLALIRAGSTSGTGTITANGASAPGDTLNDGGGGGGAGGSIVVTTPTGGSLTGLTATANGGVGGVANTANKDPHGPGGGGAGGVVLTSSAIAAANSAGGANGTSVAADGTVTAYGAGPGLAGTASANASDASIPGVFEGAICSAGITGTIYSDTNANAALNAGETQVGTGGQTVTLTDAAKNVIATTTASAAGTYAFTNVPSAEPLTVTVTPVANYVVTTAEPLTVTVPQYTTTSGVNVGLYTPAPLTSKTAAGVAGTVTPTKTPGGSLQLLNGGASVTSYQVISQGTYSTDGTTLTFTPSAGFSGTATPATFQVTNAKGETATSTYTPTITPQAVTDAFSAPASASGAVTLTVAASATTGVLANDLGSGLVVTTTAPITTSAGGTVTLTAAGGVSYAPKAGFSGSDTFTYAIKDGSGQTSSVLDTITVAPVAVNGSVTVVDGSSTVGAAVPTPVGTGPFTYALVAGPMDKAATNGFTFNADGTFSYTPKTPFSGSGTNADFFTYTVTDKATGKSNTATETLVVQPLAVTDSFTAPASATGAAVTTSPATAVLADDLGSGLTVTTLGPITTSAGGSVTLTAAGVVSSYKPKAGFSGKDTFAYTIQDGSGQTSSVTDTILVAPVAVTDAFTAPASATAGTVVVTSPATAVLANDVGTGLVVTTLGPITTSAGGSVTLTAAGVVSYAPPANFSGTDTFPYTIKDGSGSGLTSTITDTITVAPQAVTDAFSAPASASGAVTLTVAASATTGVLANDLGSGLVVTTTAPITTSAGGTVTLTAAGGVSYAPKAGFSGSDTFTYAIKDGSGQTSSVLDTITVAPVAVNGSVTVVDGSSTVGAAVPTPVGTGPFTYALVAGPMDKAATNGFTFNADGTFSYTPKTPFSGSGTNADFFTYTVTDKATGKSNTATETLVVQPLAVTDSFTAPASATGAAVTTSPATAVLADDLGSGLTVTTLGPITTSAGGSVTLTAAGVVSSYKPKAGFSGKDTFAYTIQDGSGQTSSVTDTILVAPVAVTDAFTAPASATAGTVVVTSPATAVLANDVGTGLVVTTLGPITTSAGGSVTLTAAGVVSYAPPANFSGTDTFPYTIKDGSGSGLTSTITDTITVAPVAKPGAVTVADGSSTPAGTSVPAATGSGPFTYTLVTGPADAAGTFTLNKDGTFTYTPKTPFSGSGANADSFTYTVQDGSGTMSAVVTETLTVTPTGKDDSYNDQTPGPAAYTVPDASGVLFNDLGTGLQVVSLGGSVAGSPLTTKTSLGGSVMVDAAGGFTFTPTASEFGNDTFMYTAKDASGQPVTQTVTIAVARPGAPVAVGDSASTPVNTPVTLAGSTKAGTSFPAGSTITNTKPVNGGTVTAGTPNGSGAFTYTYTPKSGYSGPDSFTYTITDQTNQTSTATESVTVTPVGADDPNYKTGYNTPETETVATGVLANDSGSNLVVTGINGTTSLSGKTANGGTVTVAAGGGFTFTPTAAESGADTFTYTASDGTSSYTQKVTITVGSPVLTAPSDSETTQAGPKTGTGTPVKTAGYSTATYAPGSKITNTGSTSGTVVLNPDDTYTYTPKGGFSGTDSFTYTITDPTGKTATGTENITVNPVANPDKIATTLPVTVTAATSTLSSNDYGSGLTVTAVGTPTYGSVTLNGDGTYTYTPPKVFPASGSDTFSYTVTDSSTGKLTAIGAVIVTLSEPTITAPDDSQSTAAGLAPAKGTPVTLAGYSKATYEAGSTFTNTTPKNGTLVANPDGTFTYTPAAGFSGTDSFTYTINDPAGQTKTGTETITVKPVGADDSYNDPTPAAVLTVADASGVLKNDAGNTLQVVSLGGSVAGSPLTTKTSLGGSVMVDAAGGFTFTPTASEFGNDTFMYTAKDASGQPVTQTVTIAVARPGAPVAVGDSASTPVNTPVTLAGSTKAGTSFPAGSTITNTKPVNGGTVTAGTPNGSGAFTYTYTPKSGYSGPDSFTYTITDQTNQTSTATESVTVTPVGADDPNYKTGYNTPETETVATGVLANDSGSNLVVTGINGTTSLSGKTANGGTVTVAAGGGFTFTPTAAESGADTFTYTASDGTSSYTQKVTITVGSPVLTAPSDSETTQAGPKTGTGTPVKTAGYSTATYAPGSKITNTGSTSGTVVLNPDNTYTYTPKGGFSGTDSFTYTITDPTGKTATGTENITVNPVGADDSYNDATPGAVLTVADASGVLLNDAGTLKVTSLAGSQAATPLTTTTSQGGTVTVNPGGGFTFTPTAAEFGPDTFQYTATDPAGQPVTQKVTVSVARPTAPVAKDDAVTTTAGPLPGSGTPVVLAGSTKAGTTFPANSTITNTSPLNGTVTPGTPGANGAFTYTYTPNGGFSGSDSFTYTITDPTGQTATGTESVTVTPVANPDTETVVYNNNTPIFAGAVPAPTGLPGSGFTYALVSSPTHAATGGFSFDPATGKYTYSPAAPFVGTDTFTYTVTGAGGTSAVATITLKVQAPAAPTAVTDALTASAKAPLVAGPAVNVVANDTVPFGIVTATVVTQGTHGTVTPSADGQSFTYTPAVSTYSGTDTFTYYDVDAFGNHGAAVTDTVTITPFANPDAIAAPFPTAKTFPDTTLTANDNGSTKTVTAVDAKTADGGSVTLNGDGTFTYTPPTSYPTSYPTSGTDSFTYTLTGDGGTSTATVTVNLTPVKPVATDDSAGSTPSGTQLTVAAPGVLGTGTTNADTGAGIVPSLVTNGAHGTATINPDGSYTYLAPTSYSGPDSFTYLDTDVAGQTSNTATVSVTVLPVGNADASKTAYVTPDTFSLTGNDYGTGDTITLISQQPARGSVTISADKTSVTYTPNVGTTGDDVFFYTGKDATGQTYGPVKVTVTVAAPGVPVANDDSPTAKTPGTTTTASTATTIAVTANDSGAGTLIPHIVGHTANGTPVVNGDNTITYTPVPGFSGIDTFTYYVTDDPKQQSNTATVTVDVTPTATADTTSAQFNQPLVQATSTLTQNDNGSNLAVTAVTAIAATKGTVKLNGDGTFTYTAPTNFFGTDTFAYTATDDSGQTVTSSVTVTVNAPAGPTAMNQTGTTPTGTPLTTGTNLLTGSTGTGDTVVAQTNVKTTNGGTVTVQTDGSYIYTPLAGYSGPDGFTFTVQDAARQQVNATVSISVTPVANDDSITVPNSSPGYTAATSTLTVNDKGSGLTVTAVDAKSAEGGTVTLNGDGTYTYVPLAGYTGTDSFGYTDTDTSSLKQTVQGTVNITVLPPRPVAANDAYGSTAGATLTVPASGVLGNDTGAGPLTVTAGSTSATTAGGTVTGGVKSDGSFAYTPPSATFSGTDTFTYTTTGAGGVSDKATVTITVKPVAPNDNQSVITGQTLTTTTPKGIGSGTLTYTLVTGPTHATGTFSVDPKTGAYSYTPDPSYTGSDTFTYTVTDGNGLVSEVGTVTIAIGKPSAPVANDDKNVAVSGGNSDPVPSVLSNDTGDILSVPAGNYTQPAAGQGSVVMATNGIYTYTAPSTFSGTTTFTYTPVDATGQAALKPATVTITVSPVAKPYSFTTAEDTATTVTLPTPAGTGPFTYTVTGKPAGTLVQNPDGTFTYTPAPGSTADDSFTYTVTSGGLTSQPATVSIGIGKAPAPVAVADTYPVTSGSTTTFDAPGVLVNDKGDQLTPNFPTKTAQGATITPTTGGGFTYTAPAGFSGTDTFPYTVTDINGTVSPAATDTITVSPVAVADPVTLTGGAPYDSTTSILANDLGSGLTVVAGSVTKPAHGTLTVNPDGTFTYTPDKGFFGTDSFSYANQDGSNPALVSQPATVTLTVFEPAVPVGKADALAVVANSGPVSAPQSVLSNDSGVGLSIKSFTQPTAGGQLTLDPATGNYSYTPPTGFSGTDTFTYVPVDEFGQTGAPVTVTITVAPVAQPDSQTVRSGSTLSAAVPAPIGTAPLSYAVTTQPSHGTLVLDPTTGAYTYTPAANYLGADSFAYTVTGAGGTSIPASVSINVVKPVPPAGVASSGTTPANTPVSGSLTGSVSGFSPLTFAVAGPPSHGAVTVSPTGSYTYTPAPGFSGTDSFTYTVIDAFGQVSDPITVTETVTPTATADTATTPEGTPLAGPSVLGNDAGTGLTAVLVTGPTHGTLTLNPNGTYTYTPNPGYAGPDSFTYLAKDASGKTSPVVAVSIAVIPGTPVITGGTQQTVNFGGTPAPITFTGPKGSTETVTTPKPGLLPPGLKLTSTGTFTGTATKAGTYTFPVTVTDPAGGTTTKNATIVIKAAPVITAPPVAQTITVGDVLKLPTLGGTIVKVTGALPPGIKVDGETLVGTGTKPGKYVVTVTISVHGKTVTRKVTITVKPKPPVQPKNPLAYTGAPISALIFWALLLLTLGTGLLFFGAVSRRRRRS